MFEATIRPHLHRNRGAAVALIPDVILLVLVVVQGARSVVRFALLASGDLGFCSQRNQTAKGACEGTAKRRGGEAAR